MGRLLLVAMREVACRPATTTCNSNLRFFSGMNMTELTINYGSPQAHDIDSSQDSFVRVNYPSSINLAPMTHIYPEYDHPAENL